MNVYCVMYPSAVTTYRVSIRPTLNILARYVLKRMDNIPARLL